MRTTLRTDFLSMGYGGQCRRPQRAPELTVHRNCSRCKTRGLSRRLPGMSSLDWSVAMLRGLFALIVIAVAAPSALAGGSGGKVVLDAWDAAYLGEGKAGYVHTIAREFDVDGKKLIHTTIELRLTVKRFSDTITMSMDTGSI